MHVLSSIDPRYRKFVELVCGMKSGPVLSSFLPFAEKAYLETRLNLVPLIHCPVAGEATEAHQP